MSKRFFDDKGTESGWNYFGKLSILGSERQMIRNWEYKRYAFISSVFADISFFDNSSILQSNPTLTMCYIFSFIFALFRMREPHASYFRWCSKKILNGTWPLELVSKWYACCLSAFLMPSVSPKLLSPVPEIYCDLLDEDEETQRHSASLDTARDCYRLLAIYW